MRTTPNVVDGRRVRVKTHYQVAGRALCNQHGGQRMTRNHDRVDCLRCRRYPVAPLPGVQAMRRIMRDDGQVIESPVVQYRPEVGEFYYIGPTEGVVLDRMPWFDVSPEGVWLVALCDGYPGEVFTEYGFGSSYEEALRYAIAAYLTPVQEWRIAEEVMW